MGTVSLNLDRREVAALVRALSAHLERCPCSGAVEGARCVECQLLAPILADADRLDRRPRCPARLAIASPDRALTGPPGEIVLLCPTVRTVSDGSGWDVLGRP